MMHSTLDEKFAANLRSELMAEARKRPARSFRAVTAVAAGILAIGGGAFAVSAANGGPDPDLPLAAPIVQTHVGSATVALPPAPAEATWLLVAIGNPDGTGTLQTARGESGMAHVEAYPLTQAAADEARASGEPQLMEPLRTSEGLEVRTSRPDTEWRIYATFATSLGSDWGGSGNEHFGLPRLLNLREFKDAFGLELLGIPNLLAVHIHDGQVGYLRSESLFGFDPVNGWHSAFDPGPLTIYAEDGITELGRLPLR